MDDPVGDWIALLAEDARAAGRDPTTYRASRTAWARRYLNDRVAYQDVRLLAALRRRMRLDRKAAEKLERQGLRLFRRGKPAPPLVRRYRELDKARPSHVARWQAATALMTWRGRD